MKTAIENGMNRTEKQVTPNIVFTTLAWLILLTGCAGLPFQEDPREPLTRPPQPRAAVTVAPTRPLDPTAGAGLWSEVAYRSAFQDLRANKIGDLITVNIVETSKANKKATTKTGRESSINAGISNLLGWEGKISKIGVPASFDNKAMFKASMENDFDGTGETTRNETMTASITARVIEVTPNGNLFIKGSRKVKVNNEAQYITLTGLVRPADISPDNTVLSSYIAEAAIEYSGSGPVSDKQSPGWLMRAVDVVWPF
ncbi:MAG: flagellar basal body L-ring protein FlgH [Deltaproteobacteria bacterium]|nr:flagellar basal body L-ring protein FlgH [Deltaproteobacteria bacterium]